VTHILKTLPCYFQSSWVGRKTFEIRNNDRHFKIDDEVELWEFDTEETGRCIRGVIDYITDFEQKKGFVVFSLHVTGRSE